MRKVAYIFFPIMLVMASCFMMGCSSLPFPGPSPEATHAKIDVGFTVNNIPDEKQNYTFEEVTSYLSDIAFDSNTNSSANTTLDKHIQLIRGDNLDDTGNASSWLFIVRHMNQTSFVTYDHMGESVINWSGRYPKEEIFLDQIMPPGKIIDKNRAHIFKTPQVKSTESRGLILTGGNYTLTITGQGVPRILVFDAKTGALISSND